MKRIMQCFRTSPGHSTSLETHDVERGNERNSNITVSEKVIPVGRIATYLLMKGDKLMIRDHYRTLVDKDWRSFVDFFNENKNPDSDGMRFLKALVEKMCGTEQAEDPEEAIRALTQTWPCEAGSQVRLEFLKSKIHILQSLDLKSIPGGIGDKDL